MKSSRGMALLWVLLLIGLSLGLAAASLAVSRMAVRTSVMTLERADGLFYAEAAAELALSYIRQNSDMHGDLVPSAATSLSGELPSADMSMRYEADLSEYNTTGDHARSLLVRVWPSNVDGESLRPFVARATLRRDLTVAEWFVLDHEPGEWRTGSHDLPRFASCGATYPHVTTLGSSRTNNTMLWTLESRSAIPDEVRVTWDDFRSGAQESRAYYHGSTQAPATTPLVASASERPVRVVYLLEAIFDGRVVDACTVEVLTGRAYFEVSPTRVCAGHDTVQVVWDANAASGVRLVQRVGNVFPRASTVSSEPMGSVSIPIEPGLLGIINDVHLELEVPVSLGSTRRVTVRGGGC